MKKVLLSILLMLLPMMASADPVEIGGIWYNLIPKGKVAEVTRNPNGDGLFSGDIVIPEKIKYEGVEYIVTKLCGGAFYNCMEVKSITLPSTIQSIGSFAVGSFENYDQFPTISVYISDLEAWCKIDFTDDVYPAFNSYNMHLNGVKIEELDISNIKTIKSKAFMNCKSIKKLKISDSVTSIGDLAFSSCSNLTSVIIGNSVTSIGDHAFSGCSGLTAVTIGSNVTSIGSYAFSGCSGLTSVTIPNSVTSIGEGAFLTCNGLTSVTIGNSVTTIGRQAFSGCNGLTSVHISDLKAWCGIEFLDYSSNPLNCAHHLYLNGVEIKDLVIPNSVTSIGSSAFSGCSGLTSVTIPNSVTSIGSYAFYGCSNLTSVTIGSSVTSIGSSAFWGCCGLTSVTIPNSVTSIGEGAFLTCNGLTSVTIGSGVTYIGGGAFANCDELTDVYCMAEKLSKSDSWGYEGLYTYPDAFQDSYPQYMTLHVPAASVEAYRSTAPWSQF